MPYSPIIKACLTHTTRQALIVARYFAFGTWPVGLPTGLTVVSLHILTGSVGYRQHCLAIFFPTDRAAQPNIVGTPSVLFTLHYLWRCSDSFLGWGILAPQVTTLSRQT